MPVNYLVLHLLNESDINLMNLTLKFGYIFWRYGAQRLGVRKFVF